MPKNVQYILCGHDDCNGHVQEIAKSQEQCGPQWGDGVEWTEFYQCDKCGKLYFAHSHQKGDLHPYEGKLTAEQLIAEVPKTSGLFYDYSETAILTRVAICRGLVNADGWVFVGNNFAGKHVNVEVSLDLSKT